MRVRRTDDFIADVERQFDWYVAKAGWDVADRYLDAVEATCRLLGQHPNLGPRGGFTHPRLREWRFFYAGTTPLPTKQNEPARSPGRTGSCRDMIFSWTGPFQPMGWTVFGPPFT